jgi:hypothetical protein
MAVLIVAIGDAFELWPAGRYLKSYDADYVPDGPTAMASWVTGKATFTDDPRDGLRFDNMAAAFECWKRQSTVQPLRPDGRPNRPLTAYTITFETVPDA